MIRFIYNMVQADKKNAQADRINIRAFEQMAQAQAKMDKQETETSMSLEKLANRKRGILVTSITEFIRIYEQIMSIHFQQGEGVQELSWAVLTPAQLGEIKTMVSVPGIRMTDGQAIAAVVFKGGISGYIHKEAEINVSVASMRRRHAAVVESQAETIAAALDAIKLRADRISDVLAKLNILFRKSMETTESIIGEKGSVRAGYTDDDKEKIMTCMNLAQAVKSLLDTPLLDAAGELTKQSIEAIQTGENYMHKLQHAMKSN